MLYRKMNKALTTPQLSITAMWAFSEAFLGGILHGMQVPFTGLVLSSFAAICMCALAKQDYTPGKILHATLLVMIVKLTLSPHTPFTAYFAVLLQGLFSEMLFFIKVNYRVACYLTSIFALMQSAFQKLIVLTVLFGMEGWKALDEFLNSVMQTLGADNVAYTKFIVSGYLLLHFITGLITGRFAISLPELLPLHADSLTAAEIKEPLIREKSKKSKSIIFWIFFILFIALIYKIYAENSFLTALTSKPLMLIIRSVIILLFWYFFLSPVLMQLLKKWLIGKKSAFSQETERILLLLPEMKKMVQYAWLLSARNSGINRIAIFIKSCFRLLLTSAK
jgi:hypothetical protein